LSNDWEWCRDIYAEKLPGGRDPVVKASEKTEGSDRVLKGGSWRYIFSNWRSGLRYGNKPDIRNALNGFRPALSASSAAKESADGSGTGIDRRSVSENVPRI
jgi:formylglycine-generating enzyme required for sulfatase activity